MTTRGGPGTSSAEKERAEADGAAAMNIEAEGSILLSTTEVNRTFVFQQLRRCGLTHDLRIITKNPRVELDHIQKQLLKDIGKIHH